MSPCGTFTQIMGIIVYDVHLDGRRAFDGNSVVNNRAAGADADWV